MISNYTRQNKRKREGGSENYYDILILSISISIDKFNTFDAVKASK